MTRSLFEAKRGCLQLLDSGDSRALEAVRQARPYDLLRWLDQSGLALYFYAACKRAESSGGIVTSALAQALARRERSNRERVKSMLQEVRAIVRALRSAGIPFAVLKGFSLAPEFCPDLYLRHHTDLDLLLRPGDSSLAVSVLKELGYVEERVGPDEIVLTVPSTHVPSHRDFLYSVERQRRVELHVAPEPPGRAESSLVSWEGVLRDKRISDFSIPVLPVHEVFVTQVLHASRHMLQGWVRLSWLWEISHCVRQNQLDGAFWERIATSLQDPVCAPRAGVLLLVLDKIFPGTAAGSLLPAVVASVPDELVAWAATQGESFVLQEFPGTYCPIRKYFESRSAVRRSLFAALIRRIWRIDEYLLHQPNHPVTLKRDLQSLVSTLCWRLRYRTIGSSRPGAKRRVEDEQSSAA